MKSLDIYIQEKFQITKDSKLSYEYFPEGILDLYDSIVDKIKKDGLGTKAHPLNLNVIDTSKIDDMSNLFNNSYGLQELSTKGYFDISKWNTSNVKEMRQMFMGSNFNGDISNWDVSSVENMSDMFFGSSFNGDLSRWDVSNVTYMEHMFFNSPLEKNPPKWYKE